MDSIPDGNTDVIIQKEDWHIANPLFYIARVLCKETLGLFAWNYLLISNLSVLDSLPAASTALTS